MDHVMTFMEPAALMLGVCRTDDGDLSSRAQTRKQAGLSPAVKPVRPCVNSWATISSVTTPSQYVVPPVPPNALGHEVLM